MKRFLLMILVVTSVGLLAAQTDAATLFSTDFQALAPGGLFGQAPWIQGGYSSTPSDIEPWFSNALVTADPSIPSNQVAKFIGDQSQGPVPGSDAGVVVTVDPNQDITFSQQTYYDSALNANEQRSLLFTLLNSTGGPFWNGNMNLTFGTYSYYQNIDLGAGQAAWSLVDSGGSWHSLAVPMDTWTTASVTFHMADSTADLSVTANGSTVTLTGIGASYLSLPPDGQTKYNLSTDGYGTGALFLDNVSITQVPEPVTMALLAFGGLALLRRRN
jgi:hypothetical protein